MMPIMPTAISSSGSVDEVSQRRLVQYCLENGAVAIGHFGIASEFHKIGDADRRFLTDIVVDAVAGKVPVFIGVTAPGVKTATEYARLAEQQGADMIMAALPYVNLPDTAGAFAYYQALSEATSLPIIVQDTPAGSSILTAELLQRLVAEIPSVHSVKGEGRDFLQKTATLLASHEDLSVIGGAGGKHLIHMLRLGVTAFMTGTEALELHAGAVHAYLSGDPKTAEEIYFQKILPYLTFYLDYPEELLKLMLHLRGLIEDPAVISPAAAAPMSPVERREFEWILRKIGYLQ
jgi:4-hydroxy-tetrahydrodipicolinate synthase